MGQDVCAVLESCAAGMSAAESKKPRSPGEFRLAYAIDTWRKHNPLPDPSERIRAAAGSDSYTIKGVKPGDPLEEFDAIFIPHYNPSARNELDGDIRKRVEPFANSVRGKKVFVGIVRLNPDDIELAPNFVPPGAGKKIGIPHAEFLYLQISGIEPNRYKYDEDSVAAFRRIAEYIHTGR